MNQRLNGTLLALLGGALTLTSGDAISPKPSRPGPGSVAYAVTGFLQQQDADNDAARSLTVRAHEISFACDREGVLEQTDRSLTPNFTDVSFDGKPLAANAAKQFEALLRKHATTSAAAKREVATEVRGVRCNCDSERCSLAVVEFDRVYTIDGVLTKRVPMRATALLSYGAGGGAKWRIYHWHASRCGEVQWFKGAKRGG